MSKTATREQRHQAAADLREAMIQVNDCEATPGQAWARFRKHWPVIQKALEYDRRAVSEDGSRE